MNDNPGILHTFLKSKQNLFFCDGCLVSTARLPRPQVNVIARTLALFPGEFVRRNTVCFQCRNSQEATMAIGPTTSRPNRGPADL
jgi:hypothetical protein